MTRAWDAVQISVDDPACRGVSSPDGRRRYDARDHVVTVPRYEADRLVQTPLASRYHKGFALRCAGVDHRAAYETWLAAHPDEPWTPYATWYRTLYQQEEE